MFNNQRGIIPIVVAMGIILSLLAGYGVGWLSKSYSPASSKSLYESHAENPGG